MQTTNQWLEVDDDSWKSQANDNVENEFQKLTKRINTILKEISSWQLVSFFVFCRRISFFLFLSRVEAKNPKEENPKNIFMISWNSRHLISIDEQNTFSIENKMKNNFNWRLKTNLNSLDEQIEVKQIDDVVSKITKQNFLICLNRSSTNKFRKIIKSRFKTIWIKLRKFFFSLQTVRTDNEKFCFFFLSFLFLSRSHVEENLLTD